MNAAEVLALYDQEQRIALQEHGLRRESTGEVVRHASLSGGEGLVSYSRLTEAGADRAIDEQIAWFQNLGQGFEWKLYGHDTPADLRQRLLARGFEAEPPESLLVLDLQEAPARLLQPVALDIRRIQDPRQLEDVGRIQESVWGRVDPAQLAALGEELRQSPDQQIIYVAYAERLPVAYGRLSFRDGSLFAGLWGGSTLEEYRGLGFYAALLAVRLQEAVRRGARFLTIDAGPMSRPIVEKFGFRFITSTQPFKWRAARLGGTSSA